MTRNTLRRAAVWLANRAAGSGYHVLHRPNRVYLDIEQPTASNNAPRRGHGRPPHQRLVALLAAHRAAFEAAIDLVGTFGADLVRIDRHPHDGLEPTWDNQFFTGIDAASLYAFLRDRSPARYVEGNSTRFAARAKRDGGLLTEIVSIDPEPRAGIDALCDTVVRQRLEDADLGVFADLGPGDIVLFDGSHRLFMNNDVATFFLDVLPGLHPEVLVGVHDITLPEDYYAACAPNYWTEQYVLAMALLAAGPQRAEPVLPCHYICIEPSLKVRLGSMWDGIGMAGLNAYGTTFWLHARMRDETTVNRRAGP